MKECQKWLDRDGVDKLRPELCNWKGNRGSDGFRKGWREALKWVREEICECLSPQEAIELINEELENG